MKRPITSLSLMGLAVGAFAQANFTIVRPVDNARVREKVKIQFPKGSVPPGGYVGIFLNGQLIDSVVPQASGKYLTYILDTKGRGLADSPAGKPDRLEAKLYVNYNDQPRIVSTSSRDLSIANVASIRIPNAGFKLRYRYQPGTELTYRVTQRRTVDTISESQNKLGGRPAELPLDYETLRMKYAVDNAYPNGDGLVRMQAMPEKGKDYAILTVASSDTPKKFESNEMAAIYMRLTSTGREVFGSIPAWFGFEGTNAAGSRTSLFAAYPLPTLPVKAVRPGDSWQTRFQNGKINLEKLYSQTSVVRGTLARGEFVGVEWEMGHPCAKLHNSIAAGQSNAAEKKLKNSGSSFGGENVKLDETIWFAMDTRQVIKVVRDTTVETKISGAGLGGNSPFGPGAGGPGGYPGGRPGASGSYPPGGPGGYPGGDRTMGPASLPTGLMQSGSDGPPGSGGRLGGRPGYPGGRPGAPGGPGGFPGGRSGAPTAAESQYVRIRTQQIFVLEG